MADAEEEALVYTERAIYHDYDEARETPVLEVRSDKLHYDNSGGEYSCTPIPALKVAALCLYQQPFGFTQEDVELLQRLRYEQRGVLAINRASLVQPIGAEEEVSARVDRLASLASRIAALLPPEVEK